MSHGRAPPRQIHGPAQSAQLARGRAAPPGGGSGQAAAAASAALLSRSTARHQVRTETLRALRESRRATYASYAKTIDHYLDKLSTTLTLPNNNHMKVYAISGRNA
ncbi:hypothetical protein ACNPQM_42715 [Streptomyces sp. NPDC056231]|uniref:hypothetical protein n=1 Tax=Streptomyces sp. NPDC056231 TaxID=3345755 RepID=UPI003AB07749